MNIARGIRSLSHRPRQNLHRPVIEHNIASPLSTSSDLSPSSTEKISSTNSKALGRSATTIETPVLESPSLSAPADPEPEFPLFSELPFELRSKIFAFALRLPLSTTSSNPPPSSSRESDRIQDFRGDIPEPTVRVSWPPLLSVCRESREEAIMYYEGIPGSGGEFKTTENEVVGRMGNRDQKGRNRIYVAGWWWDGSIVW